MVKKITTEIDWTAFRTVPRDLWTAILASGQALADFSAKVLQKHVPGERKTLAPLIHSNPVYLVGSDVIAEVEADPLPAKPAMTAIEHLPSGAMHSVTLSPTQPVQVIGILSNGRPAFEPLRKDALLIGVDGVSLGGDETFLSVPAVSVGNIDFPAQTMILRTQAGAVAGNPFIDDAIQQIEPLIDSVINKGLQEVAATQ